MLTYSLLKNHAGILLCGDYTTLRSLQEAIYDINEKSPIIRDEEGVFLALAYDARKAYQGQRETIAPHEHFPEVGVRYGVEMLWPIVLLQCRMMRASLAYFDSTKRQQALTYMLEAVLEDALAEDFKNDSKEIIEAWQRIDPSLPWAEEKHESRGAQFCLWTKAERRKKLAGLLASLDSMYPFMYESAVQNGNTELVSPADLDALEGTEWADPRW